MQSAQPIQHQIISKKQAKLQGLIHYFTGKPCKHGHFSLRFVKSGQCRKCSTIRMAKVYHRNPEKARNRVKREYQEHPERVRARRKVLRANNLERERKRWHKWKEIDPEKARASTRRWKSNNQDRVNALVAERTAQLLKAMPKWVDKKELRLVYTERRRISKETGVPHDVDHIIPLRGINVCGLHVPWNLRIIPALENKQKGNRLTHEAGRRAISHIPEKDSGGFPSAYELAA